MSSEIKALKGRSTSAQGEAAQQRSPVSRDYIIESPVRAQYNTTGRSGMKSREMYLQIKRG